MANTLSITDKTYLEGVLGMEGGYVLDFSNASFSNFFGELDIDIYDNDSYPNSHPISNSKAYRLRAFWNNAAPEEIAKAISGLAEYVDAKRLNGRSSITYEQVEKMREIANRVGTLQPTESKVHDIPTVTTATIARNQIHIEIREEIYNHIKTYLDSGDYFHAVEESYKVVRERLLSITGKEKASDVFNMNAESNRHHQEIFGYTDSPGTPRGDFLRGVGYLQLAVQFLRNEKIHTLATKLDRNLAIHYISLASLSYDLISRGTGSE